MTSSLGVPLFPAIAKPYSSFKELQTLAEEWEAHRETPIPGFTIYTDTVALVSERHRISLSLWQLPENDSKTFDLLSHGEIDSLFIIGQPKANAALLRNLRPERLEDLMTFLAFNRPGCRHRIQQYAKRKNGTESVTSPHPILNQTLAETKGLIFYQEQIVNILNTFADYSIHDAKAARLDLAKMKIDKIQQIQTRLISGFKRHGLTQNEALAVFNQLAMDSRFAMNKSYIAFNTFIVYQGAYLKAHFPLEYRSAWFSFQKGTCPSPIYEA